MRVKLIKKIRVIVAMSGGVDSSVAAALLKQQGYEVAGVFMLFWAESETASGCCSGEAEAAARLVAGKLGLSFYVWNFEKEFKKKVVAYFLHELRAGRTPNPCVFCNFKIKFGLFLEKAKKLGADFIATGHYARLRREILNPKSEILKKFKNSNLKNVYKLFTAKDDKKDQSYFLHRLMQEQLSRVIFPVGGYTKKEVYQLAKKWHLPHQAKQSFDICFTGDYRRFLNQHLKLKPGKIVKFLNLSQSPKAELSSGSNLRGGKGELLGAHQGLPFYTIGQRARLGGPGPFFVVQKDAKKNILYVSNNERDLYQKKMLVEKVNWLDGQPPKFPLKCKIKIRYGGEAARAVISEQLTINSQQFKIQFKYPQRAITPGQSAVFYGQGGEVLGGGIISA